MTTLDNIATAILHRFEPERAHELAIHAMGLGLTPTVAPDAPSLAITCLGLRFPNPIGLAAGFDKNARVIRPLIRMGFGHVEVGTVTPRPQPGNARPRLFRLPEDGAIINRMGFNGCGIDRFCRNLARLYRPLSGKARQAPGGPLGVNLGINKVGADPLRDYPELVARVRPYADYVTINLSSPNTPGLRDLQSAQTLRTLLNSIAKRNPERPPLLVKLAPDMPDDAYEHVLEAAIEGDAQGLILTNTTIHRPTTLTSAHAHETGGLSGRPLAQRARAVLRHVADLNRGRLALISVGGIETGQDILDRIQLGANMVQLYSAFVFEGAALLPRLKRELAECLGKSGFKSLDEAYRAR